MLMPLPAFPLLTAWAGQSAQQLLCQWSSRERQQRAKRLKSTSLTWRGSPPWPCNWRPGRWSRQRHPPPCTSPEYLQSTGWHFNSIEEGSEIGPEKGPEKGPESPFATSRRMNSEKVPGLYKGWGIFDVKGSVCFVLKFAFPSFSPLSPLECKFQNNTCTEPLTG